MMGHANASDRTAAGPIAQFDDRPRGAWLATLLGRVLLWLAAARERRQLRGLSDHMLHDLGLSRSDVEQEAGRPFWDIDPRPHR